MSLLSPLCSSSRVEIWREFVLSAIFKQIQKCWDSACSGTHGLWSPVIGSMRKSHSCAQGSDDDVFYFIRLGLLCQREKEEGCQREVVVWMVRRFPFREHLLGSQRRFFRLVCIDESPFGIDVKMSLIYNANYINGRSSPLLIKNAIIREGLLWEYPVEPSRGWMWH